MTTTQQPRPTRLTTTVVACPSWCTLLHDNNVPPGSGFHGGPNIPAGSGHLARLWQDDYTTAHPGEVLDQAGAHELGMALVRGADVLRRERQGATR